MEHKALLIYVVVCIDKKCAVKVIKFTFFFKKKHQLE